MLHSNSSTTHAVAWSGMMPSLILGVSGRHDGQQDSPPGRFVKSALIQLLYAKTGNMVVILTMALACLEKNRLGRTVQSSDAPWLSGTHQATVLITRQQVPARPKLKNLVVDSFIQESLGESLSATSRTVFIHQLTPQIGNIYSMQK